MKCNYSSRISMNVTIYSYQSMKALKLHSITTWSRSTIGASGAFSPRSMSLRRIRFNPVNRALRVDVRVPTLDAPRWAPQSCGCWPRPGQPPGDLRSPALQVRSAGPYSSSRAQFLQDSPGHRMLINCLPETEVINISTIKCNKGKYKRCELF